MNNILDRFDFLAEARRMTPEEFEERVEELYDGDIDTSNAHYTNNKGNVELKCNICGHEWSPMAKDVLAKRSKQGLTCCPKCSKRLSQVKSKSAFVKEANEIHGKGRYDYSKVQYVNAHTPVTIVCPIHGDFPQAPTSHLMGHGCPKCNSSKLEIQIHREFPKLEQQKKFDWLKNIRNMSLDFYDEKKKIAIECQGEQHFTQIKGFKELVENIQKRDKLKYDLCKENNIELIYYYPKEFNKYNIDFYQDKHCFHDIDNIKKYLG